MVSSLWERFILLSRKATLRERSENGATKRGTISVTRTRDRERNRNRERRSEMYRWEEEEEESHHWRYYVNSLALNQNAPIELQCCFLNEGENLSVHREMFLWGTQCEHRIFHAVNRAACSRTLTHIEIAKRAATLTRCRSARDIGLILTTQ